MGAYLLEVKNLMKIFIVKQVHIMKQKINLLILPGLKDFKINP